MKPWKIFVGIALVFSCCENEDFYDDVKISALNTEQITDSINKAYNNNSTEELQSVLDYWNSELLPADAEMITDEKTQNVYAVFQEIYNPFNISRLSGNKQVSNLYNSIKYVIVQNKVMFDFSLNNTENTTCDSVIDFKPNISFEGAKTLYLAKEYETAIISFLGHEFNILSTNGLENVVQPSEESYARMQFLNNFLGIMPCQTAAYWFIETHPYISTIHFDAEMVNALVIFRLGNMFGEAMLENTDGDWKLVSSGLNAIR